MRRGRIQIRPPATQAPSKPMVDLGADADARPSPSVLAALNTPAPHSAASSSLSSRTVRASAESRVTIGRLPRHLANRRTRSRSGSRPPIDLLIERSTGRFFDPGGPTRQAWSPSAVERPWE